MVTILFVTKVYVWPPYGGQKIHVYNVIDSLSRLFDVTVLAPLPASDCPLLGQVRGWEHLPDVATSFRRRVAESRFLIIQHPVWRQVLERLLAAEHPRIVWFNFGHWGHYADMARRHGAATVMQTHNVDSQIPRQGLTSRPLTRMHLYYAVRYPLEAWHERRLFRRCDRVLSVSEADRRYHARFVGDEASLYLPNYVNEAWYHLESPVLRDAGTVVMAGNFGAFQNQAGACWFVDRVWPMVQRAVPAARLQLVGDAPASWRGRVEQASGVTCVGRVPSVTPFLRRTTVGVVPLLHGSGTRFKILEALACELPLVSTTTGAEGIALVDGVHARLADTPAAFAQAVVELLTDDVQRQTLAGNGLALLRAEYSFEVNTERLRQIVLSLAR